MTDTQRVEPLLQYIIFNSPANAVAYPDGVGQGEGDSERQSFWNGDDEHRDADDEELDKLLEVLHLPGSLVYDERLDAEPQYEDDDCQHCGYCACTTQ